MGPAKINEMLALVPPDELPGVLRLLSLFERAGQIPTDEADCWRRGMWALCELHASVIP